MPLGLLGLIGGAIKGGAAKIAGGLGKGALLNAGANALLGGMGAGGASGALGALSGVDVAAEIERFVNMVQPIDFEKIVREPGKTFEKVPSVDPNAVSKRTLKYNTDRAIPALIRSAKRITEGMVDSASDGISELFPAFDEVVGNLGSNILARQAGELSPGARRSVARNLLSSGGVRSMGPESFGQAFAGFIGSSAEQQSMQGDTMALQAVPTFRNLFRVSGADELMPFGGLSTGQALQAELQEASREQQALQFDVSTRLEKDLNMASLTMSDRNFRYNFGLQGAGLVLQQGQAMASSGLQANSQKMGFLSEALSSIVGGFGSARQASIGEPNPIGGR